MPRPFIAHRIRRIAVGVVVVAAVGLAGTTLALAATHKHFVNPFISVSYTDNTSGAVVAAVQNGSGVGVEGIVGNTNGSIGMLGFQDNTATNGVAMEGLVWGKSSTGLYGQALKNSDTTHPSVGLLGTSSSGIGVDGESLVATGIGTFGAAADGLSSGSLGVGSAAGVIGTTGRGSFLTPGVEGESTTAGEQDTDGAFGLDFKLGGRAASIGVLAYGDNEAFLGYVTDPGTSGTNAAVEGSFYNDQAFPDFNTAVLGMEDYGTGVMGESGGGSPHFFVGSQPVGTYAISGVGSTGATQAEALVAEAEDSSTFGEVQINQSNDNEIDSLVPSGNLMNGFGQDGLAFAFDNIGNETITGEITTAGVCNTGCISQKGHVAKRVITYAAQSSEPTVEDFGEGQIVGGIGHVRIDLAFGRTIDANKSYLVFLTPEGDNRGLYVTQRTPAGFTVREAQGGTSTLGFMYRIVAKPYGVSAGRLPMVDVSQIRSARAIFGPARQVSQPLEPYAALVKEVGQARAAQMLAQAKANYQARLRMISRLPHADAQGNLHVGSAVLSQPNN